MVKDTFSPDVAPDDSSPHVSVPDMQTKPVWCGKCKADVVPEKKGMCPRCQGFLRQNFVARKHPINVLRRDQLYMEAVEEYRPITLELRDACRYIANVKERLETVRDGTPEHQRLMAMWTELSTLLRTARAVTPAQAATSVDMTDAQLEARAVRLLDMVRSMRLPPMPVGADSRLPDVTGATDEGFVIELEPGDEGYDEETTTVVPAPELTCAPAVCEYCHQAVTRCAELKALGDERWDILHAHDPDVVRKKAEAYTAEMYESLRRQRHGDPNVR